MNRTAAACFCLVMTPSTVAFAVDSDAVTGGAAGGAAVDTAVMADYDEGASSRRTRSIHVAPTTQRELVFIEALPPPPRMIQVQDP